MNERDKCFLCGLTIRPAVLTGAPQGFEFSCPACGRYKIAGRARIVEKALEESPDLRPALSAAARLASEDNTLLAIGPDNYRRIAELVPCGSVADKARRLLERLRSKSRFFGEWVEFSPRNDWPLIRAHAPEECEAVLAHLCSDGLVVREPVLNQPRLGLSWEGWETVEPIAGGVAGLGFVAMAFAEDMKDVFDFGIAPAIETDCGFKAVIVNKEHFPEKICDRIISDIRRCQFTVADFTHNRGGVYFEAGYALALGRMVIWSCREDHVKDLHFDTRQYPHIVWKQPEDLRLQLRDRLRALIPGARLN